MDLQEAKEIAEGLKYTLQPYCEKIEIAGSVRREKPQVKDIELVCIPKTIIKETVISDLFGNRKERQEIRHPDFVRIINENEINKGNPSTGKYFQFNICQEINIDCFTATKINFGWIYALRTGSADFSHQLAIRLRAAGYKMEDGNIFKNSKQIEIREEEDLFRLVGMLWSFPKYRN